MGNCLTPGVGNCVTFDKAAPIAEVDSVNASGANAQEPEFDVLAGFGQRAQVEVL